MKNNINMLKNLLNQNRPVELTEEQKEYMKQPLEFLDKLSQTKGINTTTTYQAMVDIFQDLLKNPDSSSFLKISVQDQKFQKRILQTSSSTVKLLEYIGYQVEDVLQQEDEVESFFILKKVNVEMLTVLTNEIQIRVFSHTPLNISVGINFGCKKELEECHFKHQNRK
jgi:tRNA U34 5-carboxymethylaminomethyl modifying enzyme MnmG/GidA